MQKKMATINRSVWMDKRFGRIGLIGRLTYMYLLTAPSGDFAGFFRFPVKFISADLKIGEDDVISAMDELINTGLVEYDQENELLFVPAIIDATPIKTKNHMKGLLAGVDSLPNSILWESLKKKLDTMYPKLSPVYKEFFVGRVEDGDDEPVPKVKKGSKKKDDGSKEAKKAEKEAIERAFEEFYAAYPRKTQKSAAFDAFNKVLKKDKDVTKEELVAAAQNFRNECDKKNRKVDYTPYPSSFLGRSQEYKDYLPKVYGKSEEEIASQYAYDPSVPSSMDNAPTNDDIVNMFADI